MKQLFIFLIVFFGMIIFINAKDVITLRDGSIIEAKVITTSSDYLIYQHHEYGPAYIILYSRIHSINYEDNILEEKNPLLTKKQMQSSSYMAKYYGFNKKNEKSEEKLNFGINTNAVGLIPLGDTLKSNAPAVNVEIIRNNFYSIVNLNIPNQDSIGFGFSGLFHYLWESKIGSFYLGGGLGYTYHDVHFFTFGINAGYRYTTSFGMYLNAGGYIGGKLNDGINLDFKPILGVGYVF